MQMLNKYGIRFAFNGKERDDETYGAGNAYDFGARIYDPRLGRWLSVDPLRMKYPFVSPYNYALNKPTMFLDFDGRDIITSNQFQSSVYNGTLTTLLSMNSKFVVQYMKPFTVHGVDIKLDFYSFTVAQMASYNPNEKQRNGHSFYTDRLAAVTSQHYRDEFNSEFTSYNSDAIFVNDLEESGAPVHASGMVIGYALSEASLMVNVMHEFMHARLLTHEDMATEGNRNLVSETLLQANNGLSKEQANALAWKGLQTTDAWNKLKDDQKSVILKLIEETEKGPVKKMDATEEAELNSLEPSKF